MDRAHANLFDCDRRQHCQLPDPVQRPLALQLPLGVDCGHRHHNVCVPVAGRALGLIQVEPEAGGRGIRDGHQLLHAQSAVTALCVRVLACHLHSRVRSLDDSGE